MKKLKIAQNRTLYNHQYIIGRILYPDNPILLPTEDEDEFEDWQDKWNEVAEEIYDDDDAPKCDYDL